MRLVPILRVVGGGGGGIIHVVCMHACMLYVYLSLFCKFIVCIHVLMLHFLFYFVYTSVAYGYAHAPTSHTLALTPTHPQGIMPSVAAYDSRGTDFWQSSPGGVGAVLRAAVATHDLRQGMAV